MCTLSQQRERERSRAMGFSDKKSKKEHEARDAKMAEEWATRMREDGLKPNMLGSVVDVFSQKSKKSVQAPLDNDIMDLLTRQKDELRRTHNLERTGTIQRRRKTKSTPEIVHASAINMVSSSNRSSAKYSFGAPRHQRGKLGVEVLNPRDLEYQSSNTSFPGPGAHAIPHSTDGNDLEATHGHTGGWLWSHHAVFMQTLKECGGRPCPEFFDVMATRLPEVSRKEVTDHVRWSADFELEAGRKQRRVNRWYGERTGELQDPSRTQRDLVHERQRAQEFHHQADDEEERSNLFQRQASTVAHQCFDGQVLEGNLRGHPEFRKPPTYTFGTSRDRRDVTEKRHTGLSHVRSTSALDVPGPGQYLGLSDTFPGPAHAKRSASASLLSRLPDRVDKTASTAGPGYNGPLHACTKRSMELRATQMEKPLWSFSQEVRHSPF